MLNNKNSWFLIEDISYILKIKKKYIIKNYINKKHIS